MKSPLAQVILFTFGGFIIILVILETRDWIKKEFPKPDKSNQKIALIQYPFYHDKANESLKRFNRLSDAEKSAIKRNLASNLKIMEQWLTLLNRYPYEIICIGELHDETTRMFLADKFFFKAKTDILLLETTPDQLQHLIKRMNSGRSYYPLLSADILNILRAVNDSNIDIKLFGIDETQKQRKEQHSSLNNREKAIAHNFWKHYQPGKKHIILFGNLHCAKEPGWLFHDLQAQAPEDLRKRMLSVTVLGKHQKGSVEAFVYFLHKIGMNLGDFVIPDSTNLHPYIIRQFEALNSQVFERYDTLIVFQNNH